MKYCGVAVYRSVPTHAYKYAYIMMYHDVDVHPIYCVCQEKNKNTAEIYGEYRG
jgi:hypothetical protein